MKKFLVAAAVFVIVIGGFFAFTMGGKKSDSSQSSSKTESKMDLKELNVQFTPSINSGTLLAKAKPLETLLSKQLGIPVHVSLSTDTNSMIEAMGSKKIDMGFLSPDAYVTAHKQYGTKVILQSTRYGIKDDNTGGSTGKLVDHYKSMIIVKKDSNIKSAKDLKGKKIAVQSPTSAAGYVYPIDELNKKGINVIKDSTLVQIKGHDQAVLSVLNGDTDAAFIFGDARNVVKKDQPDVFDKTRILYTTDNIPNDTISLRKGVSSADSKKIAEAMKEIAKTDEGKQILHNIYSWDGVSDSKDANFDTVRKHNQQIEKLR
ncbi:phosphate/phosphite/phosphonate ABC transporter substrate-binding protein [Fructobacillus fructosus]|uniref:Periplasmic component (PhnD) n=1 Tax=Fructobacillus fructosus TaxID=1631 RepID=A0ABM9MR68_9LACO|nr:phosphate/phosphite/phosphonate ABC transporter substrate-binding protein [Fructobacillus fructosus]MBD9365466.1 phosphate/phosphite/phosphonate ABC transporter substrate-binding protein [Leuconostoc mesenteroides]MBC9118802.1 phosphate/phosphite/phosphonate ABC transporter substrate-binding protein [Fructobacillus fructosus]CAK1234325.1 ABC-type phosphate/phosphonate transport system [Fructobacillus fructosus]CAK1236709.1 ABC-type phosphate/phosphonate transport system [Fructobacillus fruct